MEKRNVQILSGGLLEPHNKIDNDRKQDNGCKGKRDVNQS